MESFLDPFFDLVGDSPSLMLSVFVFLAVGTLAFGVMGFVRVKSSVNRRVTGALSAVASDKPGAQKSLRTSSLKTAQRLIDYSAKY